MLRIELSILRGLIYEEEYLRRAYPFLTDKYFTDPNERTLYTLTKEYIDKYNRPPTVEALAIALNGMDLYEDEHKECLELLATVKNLHVDEKVHMDWLVEESEKFCQQQALYNAIREGMRIIEGKSDNTPHALPQILQDALGVSFNTDVGSDYFENAEERFDKYQQVTEKLSFDISLLNTITRGGSEKGTLNCILAGTNVGKSLALCHFAQDWLAKGKNVVYISLEMAEEKLEERVDANLMDVAIADLPKLTKDHFLKKIGMIRKKTSGVLKTKQFPTSGAHVGHFRHFLNELKLKSKFVPDVIIIDYLNICASSRYKNLSGVNSYTLVKAIAEELRGLAIEFGVPIWTATQTNRDGQDNSNVSLTNVSESHGLSQTVDFMFALTTNEELEKIGQLQAIQLKNRYSTKSEWKRFMIGVDYSRMRIYDVEQDAQEGLSDKGETSKPMGQKPVFAGASTAPGLVAPLPDANGSVSVDSWNYG